MIANALKDYVHLEMADDPTAWCYYGETRQRAEESGRYLWYKSEALDSQALLIDIGRCSSFEAVSFALTFSKCRVMVADRSEAAFKQARKYFEDGVIPDLLVVSRTYPGTGISPEVYAGEFGLKNVCGIPDEVAVIFAAQSQTCGFSKELSATAEEITVLIHQIIEKRGI
jgi:hypothetical protein